MWLRWKKTLHLNSSSATNFHGGTISGDDPVCPLSTLLWVLEAQAPTAATRGCLTNWLSIGFSQWEAQDGAGA